MWPVAIVPDLAVNRINGMEVAINIVKSTLKMTDIILRWRR